MVDFAKCKETSISVSGIIADSEIYYGLYIPKKPIEDWHEGWKHQDSYPVFTHFWVEKDDEIIDLAAEQFGEEQVVITPKTDPHYVKVGRYNKNRDKVTPLVAHPSIEWNSLNDEDKIVRVVWPDVEEYLATLG